MSARGNAATSGALPLATEAGAGRRGGGQARGSVGSRRIVVGRIGIKRIGAGGLRGTLRITLALRGDGTATAVRTDIRLQVLEAHAVETRTLLAHLTQLMGKVAARQVAGAPPVMQSIQHLLGTVCCRNLLFARIREYSPN
ncbi:hypothetical protein T492DRAFT_837922 [Pavlovales sp. CCMP2436]|nr:hypothetical protein T492DRAFT_837922 [Pavlovales sp. CCMP2436]